MPSMPSSPPSATTSACSSAGSRFFAPISWPHSVRLVAQPIGQSPPEWRSSRSTRSGQRSEEHTSELQSLMRISYAVFCLKKKKQNLQNTLYIQSHKLTQCQY